MAMTEEKYEALIKRLEVYAHKHPAVYKLRVALLNLLGYAYIFAVLAGALLLFGLVLLIIAFPGFWLLVNSGWVTLVFVGITLRALWVRFPKPSGIELSYEDAPRLFDLIGELTTALQAPSIRRILLTSDHNASIIQWPRLGVFGWHANYLVLGLPLMQTLSPEQFRAILAHELGHLSSQHGRMANWSYRLRQMWWQLLISFEAQKHTGVGIYRAFFKWYVPFLNAYTYVLSRAHEYEADRYAANQSSARHFAEALLMTVVSEHYLNAYFWPQLRKQAAKQAVPPLEAFSTMVNLLPPQIEPNDAKIWLQQALLDKTYHLDTHPALTDRLSALGFPTVSAGGRMNVTPYLAMLVPAHETAAVHFLGKTVKQFIPTLNYLWQDNIKPHWQELHQLVQGSQKRLAKLEAKAGQEALTPAESRERLALTLDCKENDEAIPLLQELLTVQPDDASANFDLGKILLEKNDAKGLAHLEKAMALEPYNAVSSCELAARFLKQQGKAEEAAQYQERGAKQAELLSLVEQERSTLNATDKFQPHQLPESEIATLQKQIKRAGIVSKAYWVRKEVAYLPEKPLYVLGIVPYESWQPTRKENDEAMFLARVLRVLDFSGDMYMIVLSDSNPEIERALSQVEGSLIYRALYET